MLELGEEELVEEGSEELVEDETEEMVVKIEERLVNKGLLDETTVDRRVIDEEKENEVVDDKVVYKLEDCVEESVED